MGNGSRRIQRMRRFAVAATAGWVASSGPASQADEGLWSFHEPPVQALRTKYGFDANDGWLDTLRMAALQVSGASGSFVSPRGLVLTNHHVALSCLQKLSTAGRDLVRDGFMAGSAAEELRCPGFEVKRHESSEDVTAAVQAAVKSRDSATANSERNAAITGMEQACATATRLRCEMETLFHGAAYRLHRYRRVEGRAPRVRARGERRFLRRRHGQLRVSALRSRRRIPARVRRRRARGTRTVPPVGEKRRARGRSRPRRRPSVRDRSPRDAHAARARARRALSADDRQRCAPAPQPPRLQRRAPRKRSVAPPTTSSAPRTG